ncbi:hypothetical protein OMP38_03185 [Cohnella ginsengisoli]|uniref:Uncharacterized protein n=1 Tax=Cohnella ginsengisoli TaxID=425004 RepID=A0A9X4QLC6_9BACL|nr:hypothetical protein [Cohnella ginsengisoli]MDG0789967.1 hypothetical protein [Cohnella ginsengisoli]
MQEQLLVEIRDLLSDILLELRTANRQSSRAPIRIEDANENVLPGSQGTVLTSNLFRRIVDVYYKEELERIKSGNSKKSARRVSVELGKTLADLFNEQMAQKGMTFQRMPDGMVIGEVEEESRIAIKLITDTGYYRGEHWNEIIEDILESCEEKYGIKNDRVYFIIASLRNGLDQSYIEKLLGEKVRSNGEFLKNRSLVLKYIKKFKATTTSLAAPYDQIYVMASEMHPNVLAEDLHKMTNAQMQEVLDKLDEYEWLSDLSKLVSIFKKAI